MSYKIEMFIVIALILSLAMPLSQLENIDAATTATWNDDINEWKSYGQNGWTETKADVPKWSCTNAVASQSGDPATNPLAIPTQLASEKVTYNQMNQMTWIWQETKEFLGVRLL